MKHFILLGAIFVLSFHTSGQAINSENLLNSAPVAAAVSASTLSTSLDQPEYATAATPGISAAPIGKEEPGLAELPAAPSPQVSVQSVFESYPWEVYGGYTFIHFNEGHGLSPNLNGFNYGVSYFPGNKRLGLDGEFVLAFGSQGSYSAKLLDGMGGVRYRIYNYRGLQFFAHGMVGGSHFLPQTAYGSQSAFGYQLGGGADLGRHLGRFALRLQGDMLATHYFSTFQYSPKITAGIVYKF
jgi:hypothetical protein